MHINKPDYYKELAPEMASVVDRLMVWQEQHPKTKDYYQDFVDARAEWNRGGPEMVKVFDVVMGEITLRFHIPVENSRNLPVTLYFHGGSFVVGNNDTHSRVMRTLAEQSGTIVVGVDYRLAPKHKYPAWVEDGVSAVDYLRQHGEGYGIDVEQIHLCGDSAGCHVALATALSLRDRGGDIDYLKSQVLYYGWYGMGDSISYRRWGNQVDGIMREERHGFYPHAIVGEKDALHGKYFDLFSQDLTHGIPPTFICCGEIDPLLDNSVLLYEILKDKGIACELKLYQGVMHSFIQFAECLADGREALSLGGAFLRKYSDIT